MRSRQRKSKKRSHIQRSRYKLSKLKSRKKSNTKHSIVKRKSSIGCKKYYVAPLKELNPISLRDSLERVVPCDWIEVSPTEYKNYKYKKGDSNPTYLDFLFQDGEKSDIELYQLLTKVRGRLNADAISNKANLHRLLNYYGQRNIIAHTDIFDHSSRPNFNKYKKGKWIWRPSSGWEGRGVHVVSSAEELKELWADFKKTKKYRDDSILISKYIDSPLLIGGYKFHIRMHLILKVENRNRVSGALVHTGEIIRSKLPYIKKDYRNENIHDTHARYNTPLIFPEDFPSEYSADTIFEKMLIAVSISSSIASSPKIKSLGYNPISVYPEASGKKTTGFEIFGCDFMVDEKGKVYLIEINRKPGFSEKQLVNNSRNLFTTIAELLYGNEKDYTYASPVNIQKI
jgi:Tubulin-tyrosine ligase family